MAFIILELWSLYFLKVNTYVAFKSLQQMLTVIIIDVKN